MPIDGLTQAQSDFVEAFILVPKRIGRKKAKDRRDTAIKEFRRFNVNRDAVATRIAEIQGDVERKLLMAELGKAEALIGDNPGKLDFDAAMVRLAEVNAAVGDHKRQAEVKAKHALAVMRMDLVESGPPLDNLDDIELVWTYAENSFLHAVKSNDQTALAAADKSFDQLFDLIQAGREDIRGEGREARRKLRDIAIALQELDETLNTAFTVAHVPPPVAALLKTVKDQLDAGETAAVEALPGVAAAAQAALGAADTAGKAVIADKRRWEQEHDRFRPRHDVMDAHPLAGERDHVAPKFRDVTDAYQAAAARALRHEYAGAAADLAPLFAQLDAALRFADDYQNFLAVLDRRRAEAEALPDPASRSYDQVRDAIAAVKALVSQALAARDGGDMGNAVQRLDQIHQDAPAAAKLVTCEEYFEDSHPKLASWHDDFEDTADMARLMAPDIALIRKVIADATAAADAGNISDAYEMVANFWSYKTGMNARKALIVAYLDEKAQFALRLAEAKAFKGRIAVEEYYQQLKSDRDRMATWEARLDVDMALKTATALKGQHDEMKTQAGRGETYLDLKDEIDAEIARLEGGAAGAEYATASIALARQLMADALAMRQKGDWFQAVRLMGSAKDALATGTLAAKNARIVDDMVDADRLDDIGTDFDAAYAVFTSVRDAVAGVDADDLFANRLKAADTKASGARAIAAQPDPGPAQARAIVEEAIRDCKEVMKDIAEAAAYSNRVAATKSLLSELKKANKDKCVQPEIDAAQGFLDGARRLATAAAPDFAGARAELARAEQRIRDGFGVTPYYKRYKKSLDGYEKLLKKLRDARNATALNTEASRFGDLVDAIRQDFTDRRIADMEKKIAEADQLVGPYARRVDDYQLAVKRYASDITDKIGAEMNNPGTTALATEIRAAVADIDRAMADHLYDAAFFMIRDVGFLIEQCRKQAAAHDAWLPVRTAARSALDDLADRDEPENGPGRDRLAELQAGFDGAIGQETLLNYSGAARRLEGFVEKCAAAEPLFDKFDLYVTARDRGLAGVNDIRDLGTDAIAPLFRRIEGRRDNALRIAGAFDFDTAITLFQELLGDCATARNALAGQAAFGSVMDALKAVGDGDAEDLRMSIDTARAALKQLGGKPAALFVKAALDGLNGRIDAASAGADADFDRARAELVAILDDCRDLAGEMGRFEQFTDTVDLARKLSNQLLDSHPQADFTRDEVTALRTRIDDGMASVRSDPTRRAAVRDDVEAVIATCRDLRRVLDAHQQWHLEHRQVALDFAALEKNKDRSLIATDLAGVRTCLDASAARAAARDHGAAAAQLAKARDHIAQAHLRIKVSRNEAPGKDELKRLLAAPDGHKLLDDIINNLEPDVQRKVMNVAFEARFGCKLDLFASPDKERKGRRDKDLGKKAPNIKRFFELMSALPPSSTLDNDSMLIFSHAGTEAKGSYYDSGAKEVAMREGEAGASGSYAVGLEQELGQSRDQLHLEDGMPMSYFSWNTLHEVGHAVDDKLGFMKRNAGLAGWRVFGANVRPVADAIATELNFDSDYVAEYISQGPGSAPPIPVPVGCDAEEWERRRREACVWIDRVRHKQKPWSNDSIARQATTRTGKVYHESYQNDWSCYDYAARAVGVSGYQFRAPGEWFSELYAAVHSRKLKNTHPHYATIAAAE